MNFSMNLRLNDPIDPLQGLFSQNYRTFRTFSSKSAGWSLESPKTSTFDVVELIALYYKSKETQTNLK